MRRNHEASPHRKPSQIELSSICFKPTRLRHPFQIIAVTQVLVQPPPPEAARGLSRMIALT